ncbi:MAG: hypothetical protein FJX76_24415 [Armatimonadetes bacterium]|nr:hypothetical protein [Armatimonadota bacterium]
MHCYESADALYRGDLFADDPLAEWCWAERESLREDHLRLLTSLARLWSRQADRERGIACFRRVLRADPLREEAHQGLMEALWRQGRRSEALHQFDECARLLRTELDVDVLPETRRLRDALVEETRD